MKKLNLISNFPLSMMGLFFMLLCVMTTRAQDYNIRFAPLVDADSRVDRIVIKNLSTGTSLSLKGTDILHLGPDGNTGQDSHSGSLAVYPNPMQGQSEISFSVNESGSVQVSVFDARGQAVVKVGDYAEPGTHYYMVSNLSPGMYVVNVTGKNFNYSAKLISQFLPATSASLLHTGFRKSTTGEALTNDSQKPVHMAFTDGDVLKFTGFSGQNIAVIMDIPVDSKTIEFSFTESGTGTLKATWACGDQLLVKHQEGAVAPVSKKVLYDTKTHIPGEPSKCWIMSNLGASRQPLAFDDNTEESAGWYWQFNLKRGFKHDGSTITPVTLWISNIAENSDWTAENDPCRIELQDNWRIPTMEEWTNVSRMWEHPWTSELRVHKAGVLNGHDGSLLYRGRVGSYWSSTQDDEVHAWNLCIDCPSEIHPNKPYGSTLRCIRDEDVSSSCNAGVDQKICGSVTFLSATPATPPENGKWSVESGNGGNIVNPEDPGSEFNGIEGEQYLLRWNVFLDGLVICFDEVTISFVPAPPLANAGPDQTIAATSTTLDGNDPAPGTGLWTVVSGTGYTLTSPSAYNSPFSGLPNTAYVLHWTISGDACPNHSTDEVIITFQDGGGSSCAGIPTVQYEGHTYHTVQIGEQCWFRENLDAGQMIPRVGHATNNGIVEKYCYDDDPAQCSIYGGLYLWNEAMQYSVAEGSQGICPSGWHIPTWNEWTVLTNYLGGNMVAGGPMKETGFAHWSQPNTGATNTSDFTGLPGGAGGNGFIFIEKGTIGFWWSSSLEFNRPDFAWTAALYYLNTNLGYGTHAVDGSGTGHSLRCIKDPCSAAPATPSTGTHVPSQTGIIWNWNAVTGATGYKWNTTNDFATATDMGSLTTNTETGLVCNTAYTRYVWAYNACGYSAPLALVQSTLPCDNACAGVTTVVYEGQTYNTVAIGAQCWLKENLNVGTMIPGVSDQTNNGIVEKYCYDNDQANCTVYGGLYQWNEVMQYQTQQGTQGICPSGWHVPTNGEMNTLTDHLGGMAVAGGKMKTTGTLQAGTGLWEDPNLGATNESGFSGVPSGYLTDSFPLPYFYVKDKIDCFWSSTESSATHANYKYLYYGNPGFSPGQTPKVQGFSIRCLKN